MPLNKALLLSITYVAANAFFGLAPLWMIFQLTLFNFAISYQEVIKEGIVMFFCIAIIGGISFDYYFSREEHKSSILKYLTFVAPFVFLFFVGINFMGLNYLPSKKEFDFSKFNVIQWLLVVFTVAYCLIVKTKMFISEKRSDI